MIRFFANDPFVTHKLAMLVLLLPTTVNAQIQPDTCHTIDSNSKRLACYDKWQQENPIPITETVLDERLVQETVNHDNSFSLIAHNSTYLMPLTYASTPNDAPFAALAADDTANSPLENMEVKFQISFRVPINRGFFFRNSDLWFAYTQLSMWQLYDSDNSAPFRETNYEPEIIWSFLLNQSIAGIKLTHFNLSLSHQSNGRSGSLSRSWNRIYFESIWAHKTWAFSFRPWYRIPERKSNDDNPDIDDYLGHFDFRAAYKQEDKTFSTLIRSALDEDASHNYYELGYSFSINRKFRGYIQFVSGYGETLIDYNHRNRRLSIGIMLNDWF